MSKEELIDCIIETLNLPNYIETVMTIEQKLNEVIESVGGNSSYKY